jgi:putative metalloprotease
MRHFAFEGEVDNGESAMKYPKLRGMVLLCLFTLATAANGGGLLGGKGGDKGLAVGAVGDAVKGLTLSDADVAKLGAEAALAFDKQNKIAQPKSTYSARVDQLARQLGNYDGLKLNFKVYLDDTVNAFALPDGSIRIYSGLLDKFDDHELLFVIGHEIGHVKHGHSKKRFKTAYLASAARKGVASNNSAAGSLAGSELGGVVEAVVNAQFSQQNELESDGYGFDLLKAKKVDPQAAVSALEKLAKLGGGKGSILSTHPDPKKRAEKLRKRL